jgi:hypothetical protein
MRKTPIFLTVLGLSLASLFTAISTAPAQTDTKGKVTLESKSVALGIGVSWGDGILEYRGKKYPFTVEGLSVLDLGVAKVSATGVVSNLKKLEDFNGNYVLAAAGAGVGGGAGAAALKNQNGVEMALTATGQGVQALPRARLGCTSKRKPVMAAPGPAPIDGHSASPPDRLGTLAS